MSRILLIEPQKILQQAITRALFPEHDVDVKESMHGSGPDFFEEYELVIVDGTALREIEALTADDVKAIQACKIPTIWLEEDSSAKVPEREKLLVVKKPLENEPLQSALATFLAPKRSPQNIPTTTQTEADRQESFQFIELVDVVEEQTSQERQRKPAKRSK